MTEFEFLKAVWQQYATYKQLTEETVIEQFNKYRIFQYLISYKDIFEQDQRLFEKIDLKIEQAK